jgi:predicted alpha/beta hydrolase
VLARYYHYYARFLAEEGFAVITYDYRGIGASRPASLRGSRLRWRDWGELDFDAVVTWARTRDSNGLLAVVGHSIGGFLPGSAPAAIHVDRFLTIGAQYAYWRDYAASKRAGLVWKWHVAGSNPWPSATMEVRAPRLPHAQPMPRDAFDSPPWQHFPE